MPPHSSKATHHAQGQFAYSPYSAMRLYVLWAHLMTVLGNILCVCHYFSILALNRELSQNKCFRDAQYRALEQNSLESPGSDESWIQFQSLSDGHWWIEMSSQCQLKPRPNALWPHRPRAFWTLLLRGSIEIKKTFYFKESYEIIDGVLNFILGNLRDWSFLQTWSLSFGLLLESAKHFFSP